DESGHTCEGGTTNGRNKAATNQGPGSTVVVRCRSPTAFRPPHGVPDGPFSGGASRLVVECACRCGRRALPRAGWRGGELKECTGPGQSPGNIWRHRVSQGLTSRRDGP